MNVVLPGSRRINLSYYLVCLYTAAVLFADSTVFFYAIASFFIILEMLSFLSSGKKTMSVFYVLHISLTFYCAMSVVAGQAMFPSITLRRSAIMFLNLVINIGIAEQMRNPAVRSEFFDFYCTIALVFEIYIIILSGSRIFLGRLGIYANSPLASEGYYNPNGVGLTLLTALMLDIYCYLQKHEKKRVFRSVVYIAGILLTGSRKAIVSAFVVAVTLPVVYTYRLNGKAIKKLLKYLTVGSLVSAALLLILFKIPIVYEIAGSRVEAMVANINNRDVYEESSLKYRDIFEDLAKEYFLRSPVFGIGVDGFSQVSIYRTYSHNNYWELLAGGGIIGFTLYYLTYLCIIIGLLSAVKDKKQHALIMLYYLFLLIIMDSYMVSYLSREQLMFLFIAYSVCQEPKNGYQKQREDSSFSNEPVSRMISSKIG